MRVGCAAVHRTSDIARTPEAPARPAAAGPVFVDGSGRRQRRVRRLGRLLLLPAAGYLVLLVSAAFGGPTVSSPYVPLPKAGHPRPGGAGPAPAPHHPTPTGRAGASPRVTGTAPPAATAPRPSSHPTGASPTATAPPLPAPTVTHGKSTASHPVPTHTGHGHA